MKINIRRNLGVLFLFLGALILIQNLELFKSNLGSMIGTGIYGIFSIYLFLQFNKEKEQWWWLILGFLFVGLGLSSLANIIETFEQFSAVFGITMTGLGFIIIYTRNRNDWWALIPGSILVSLGIVQYLEIASPGTPTNGIMFLGMGTAFLLMYLIPTKLGRMNWPLIPTVVFFALGVTNSLNQELVILSILGPALLIFAGLLVLAVALKKK